jgi:hypothetical protein
LVLAFATGCENAEQRNLSDQAMKMEQTPIGDSSFLTVEAYRKVVRLDATSRLGQAAQQRIDRIQNIMRVLYYDPYTPRRLRQGPGGDAGGDARRLCRDGGTWLLLVANWDSERLIATMATIFSPLGHVSRPLEAGSLG